MDKTELSEADVKELWNQSIKNTERLHGILYKLRKGKHVKVADGNWIRDVLAGANTIDQAANRPVPKKVLCLITGINTRIISEWQSREGMPKVSRGMYSLPQTLPWILNRYKKMNGKGGKDTDVDKRLHAAQADFAESKAEKEQLIVDEIKGELIRLKIKEAQDVAKVVRLRVGLANLGTSIRSQHHLNLNELGDFAGKYAADLCNGFAGLNTEDKKLRTKQQTKIREMLLIMLKEIEDDPDWIEERRSSVDSESLLPLPLG